jgi:hypothetical protein
VNDSIRHPSTDPNKRQIIKEKVVVCYMWTGKYQMLHLTALIICLAPAVIFS